MKFCKNCGAEVHESQKFCPQCGTPAPLSEAPVTETQVSTTPKPHKKTNKSVFMILGLVLLAALLFGLYQLLSSKWSPERQAEAINTAIKNKDADQLAGLLKSDGQPLATDQAEAFMKLLSGKGATDSFTDQLTSQAESVPATIKLADKPLLNISRDGKKYGIFNDYQFNVAEQEVNMEASDSATLKYKLGDKELEAELMQNETVKLGSVPAGIYTIPASKEIDGQNYTGELNIDTTQSPEAVENFKMGYLTVSIEGGDTLDAGDTRIIINDDEMKYDDTKEKYGPLNTAKEIEIYAEGELDGKNFKTPSELITPEEFQDGPVDVTLKFNDNEISNYIADKEESSKPSTNTVIIREKEAEDHDTSSDIKVTNAGEAYTAALNFAGGSFHATGYEIRTPEPNATGWGFGIFDDNGSPIRSYNIHPDGYVIEYDSEGTQVDSGYAY